jgi:hypothetical protein
VEENGRDADAGADNVKPILHWMKHKGKLSTVAGHDGRVALEGAWLRPERSPNEWQMTATDSYAMVWVKCNIEHDEPLRERAEHESQQGIFIPARALVELERSRDPATMLFEEDGSVTVGDITFHLPSWRIVQGFLGGDRERELDGRPDQPKAIGGPDKFQTPNESPFSVGLSSTILASVARSLNSPTVKLTFDTENALAPVGIHPLMNPDGGQAIQMPVRLNL